MLKIGPIITLLRTKDTLRNIATKNHQHQRNSKPKHWLEVMLTVFWNSDGIVLTCWPGKCAKVNSKCYYETLKKSQKTHHKKGGRNLLRLAWTSQCQASNKCCHNWCHCKFGVYRLPHPAYSLDLTPSNFLLFPKLKENFWGQNFSSDEEVMAAVRHWFLDEEKDFLKDAIQKLVEQWHKCIEVRGDYMENWLCTVVNKG